MTAGTSIELDIQATTINVVCHVFAQSRDAKKRCPKWRGAKSLGWIPFRAKDVQVDGAGLVYRKRRYRLWHSRALGGEIRGGSFSSDARGRWYVNVLCEVDTVEAAGSGEVGVDLGLKSIAALSDGTAIENPRHLSKHAGRLAKAQRAGSRRRTAAIHTKIANCRRDHLHKETTRLANTYQRIVVGDVSASRLARTNMAKSVNDAGWATLKEMLRYKLAMRRGAEYVEVSERLTTQTCSGCGCIAGPKGRAGLNERVWTCVHCGVTHDRDVNAAKNILGAGRRPLVEEMAA